MKQNFECKKAENCFRDANSYEYRLPKTSEELMDVFMRAGKVSRTDKFKRPFYMLTLPNGTRIKGLVQDNMIKASFLIRDGEQPKKDFEAWLNEIL